MTLPVSGQAFQFPNTYFSERKWLGRTIVWIKETIQNLIKIIKNLFFKSNPVFIKENEQISLLNTSPDVLRCIIHFLGVKDIQSIALTCKVANEKLKKVYITLAQQISLSILNYIEAAKFFDQELQKLGQKKSLIGVYQCHKKGYRRFKFNVAYWEKVSKELEANPFLAQRRLEEECNLDLIEALEWCWYPQHLEKISQNNPFLEKICSEARAITKADVYIDGAAQTISSKPIYGGKKIEVGLMPDGRFRYIWEGNFILLFGFFGSNARQMNGLLVTADLLENIKENGRCVFEPQNGYQRTIFRCRQLAYQFSESTFDRYLQSVTHDNCGPRSRGINNGIGDIKRDWGNPYARKPYRFIKN